MRRRWKPGTRRIRIRTIPAEAVPKYPVPRERIDLVRRMLYEASAGDRSPAGKLGIWWMDRISALSGVPWALVYREVVKEGL